MEHVAIYCRISKDPEGRAEGVDAQDRHASEYATRLWPGCSTHAFVDNDLSAANGGPRPGYTRMLAAIEEGRITQVVVAEQSRLTRQPAEWEALVATLAAAGITTVHTYRNGPIDVGSSKLVGRILSAVDADEVDRMKARLNDKLDSLAAAGRPGGGHHVAYRHDRNEAGEATLEVIPEVAAQIRLAAGRVLAGWTMAEVAEGLTRNGVATRSGGPWSHTTVKGALTSPIVAGLRVHRGQVVRMGTWSPVLDETTWRMVCAVLERPRRNGARRYLLTGLARCGRCGHVLTGRQQHARGKARPIYFCSTTTGGCGRLGVNAEPLEVLVVQEMLDALDSPSFRAAMATDEHEERRGALIDELRDIETRQVELADRWATGELDAAAWDAARGRLEARQAEVSDALASVPAPVVDIDPATIRAGWDAMGLGERQAILAMFIAEVVVAPATPGARAFDPGRAQVRWV